MNERARPCGPVAQDIPEPPPRHNIDMPGLNFCFQKCDACGGQLYLLESDDIYTFYWCSVCGSLTGIVKAHGDRSKKIVRPATLKVVQEKTD